MSGYVHGGHIRAKVRPYKGNYGTRYHMELVNTVTGKTIGSDNGWASFQQALTDAGVTVLAARKAWSWEWSRKDLKR